MKTSSGKSCILLLSLALILCSCGSRKNASRSKDERPDPKTEKDLVLRKKYATILSMDVSEVRNVKLYEFIDDWTGAPYKYGGKNKSGIDCSGFTEMLYKTVYERTLSGSSRDLFDLCNTVSKDKLKEGDLVFFKIESEKMSHVGVYLANDKFVHATVKRGVMISDLKEAYYQKYYYKGGRLK